MLVLLRLIRYCCAVFLSLLNSTLDFRLTDLEYSKNLAYFPAFSDIFCGCNYCSKYFVLAVSFPVGHHGVVFHPPPSRKTLSVFSRLIALSLVKMPFSKGVMSGCRPFMPWFQSFLDAICLSRSHQSILGCHSVIPGCRWFSSFAIA